MKRVTLKDVALEAGVSINTASRALNNKPEISPETKEKVLKVAQSLGYRPNRLARALRSNKTGTIGVIVGDIANPYFSMLVRGIERTARQFDYSVILQGTDEDYDREEEAIEIALAEQVDGILITPTQKGTDTIEELVASGTPFVLMSRYFKELDTDYVVMDDRRGGFLATEHLIQRGHRRIAILNGPLHISSAIERYEGYLQAFKRYGLDPDKALVAEGCLTVEDGYRAALCLLDGPERPTAVFAFSDFVAFGVLRAANELDLRVPDDLAVVGFDDTLFGVCMRPPLTTVGGSPEGLGEQAARLLFDRVDRGQTDPVKLRLPVRLVQRKST
ncbi:MAG: Transcriptional regulator, LacI family [Acetothermia bacterium 64_32]|nr:MAG: Transcriptional regulator, LacI family [Acetothermia bacterium 64_32]HAF70992.1 LacI family transcriptional regulator [Candidatus Acetothermia bacterium]